MKTYTKQQSKGFNLDAAITAVFGKSVSVVKVFNLHTCGTVEIDGKAFDWVMSVSDFKFMEA